MAQGVSLLAVAIFTGIANFGMSALAVIETGKPLKAPCAHEKTETIPGSTMGNVRVKCAECGEEFEP